MDCVWGWGYERKGNWGNRGEREGGFGWGERADKVSEGGEMLISRSEMRAWRLEIVEEY